MKLEMDQPVGMEEGDGFAGVKEDVEKSDEGDSGLPMFRVIEEPVEPSDLDVRLGVERPPVVGDSNIVHREEIRVTQAGPTPRRLK
jgi:hypothetical protein